MDFLSETLLSNLSQKKSGNATSRKETTSMTMTMTTTTTTTFGVWHHHLTYGEGVQDGPPSNAARGAATYLSVPERRVIVKLPLVRAKAR